MDKKKREKIEREIEKSMRESPASVNEIARKTGYPAMEIWRVYVDLGFVYDGSRWIYRHNQPTREDDE